MSSRTEDHSNDDRRELSEGDLEFVRRLCSGEKMMFLMRAPDGGWTLRTMVLLLNSRGAVSRCKIEDYPMTRGVESR